MGAAGQFLGFFGLRTVSETVREELSGRSSETVEGPKKKKAREKPKRLKNCPGGAPKGSETVREEPKKAQKLSARGSKRLRNCAETVREEPRNAQEGGRGIRLKARAPPNGLRKGGGGYPF